MALEEQDPLARAVEEALRHPAVPADVWERVRDRVRQGVRSAVGPGEPVRVLDSDAEAGVGDESVTWVSTRVLVALLRGALSTSPTYAPAQLDVRLDGDRLERLVLGLVAAYGADLGEVADEARRASRDVVAAVLGQGTVAVDVEVLDVVVGDPRTT